VLTEEIKKRETKKFPKDIGWGRWVFNLEALSLITKDTKSDRTYYLALSTCNSSSQILDWIANFLEKDWTSNQDMGDLIQALNELLDFQMNFVGNGIDESRGNGSYAERIIKQRLKLAFKNNFIK